MPHLSRNQIKQLEEIRKYIKTIRDEVWRRQSYDLMGWHQNKQIPMDVLIACETLLYEEHIKIASEGG